MTFIKKDALLSIKVGAGYLQRLQTLLINILDSKSEEELKRIEDMIRDGRSEEEKEIYDIETIFMIIKTIEDTAHNDGQTEERAPTE